MRLCSLCKKKYGKGSGNLFQVPRDATERAEWSQICGRYFAPSNLLCADHFLPKQIIRMGGNKAALLSNAKPVVRQLKEVAISLNNNNEISTTQLVSSKLTLKKATMMVPNGIRVP